jgi:hypothetical protein
VFDVDVGTIKSDSPLDDDDGNGNGEDEDEVDVETLD